MWYGVNQLLSDGALDMGKVEDLLSNGAGVIHDLYDPMFGGKAIINELQSYMLNRTEPQLPIMFVEECLHGVQQAGKTILPQQIATAASFDHDIAFAVGAAIGKEARAYGIVQCFAPVIGTARDPRWGRVEETFGESSRLTSELALQWVLGAQGGAPDGTGLSKQTSIVAEPKHFVAHSQPESGTNAGPVHVGPRELLETFSPQFEWAVKYGGARGIMAAYNEIDGIPNCANNYTMTELLRNEWGFQGWVLADDGAVHMMQDTHRTASTPADAISQFLTAGGNVQYYDFDHDLYAASIVDSIANGTLSEVVVDSRVADILRVKMELGLFTTPFVDPSLIRTNVDTPEHQMLALQGAREAMVLLQNKAVSTPLDPEGGASAAGPVLPLNLPTLQRIAVVGPSADTVRFGDYSGGGIHERFVTLLQGLQDAVAAAGTATSVSFTLGSQVVSPTGVLGGKPYGLDFLPIPRARLRTLDGTSLGLNGSYWRPSTPRTSPPDFTRWDADLSFSLYAYGPAAYVRSPVTSGALFNDTGFAAVWEGFIIPPTTAAGVSIGMFVEGAGSSFTLYLNHSAVQSQGGSPAVLDVTSGVPIPVRVECTRDPAGQNILLAWSLLPNGAATLVEDDGIAAAVAMVGASDVAVVVIGESDGLSASGTQTVGEGVDVDTLDLPGRQEELVLRLAATGTPIVVVLLHGRPLSIPRVAAAVPAILSAWFPGQAGGQAIAEVLTGAYNPAGRTPITWPVDVGQLPCFFDYKPSARRGYTTESSAPLWPFGHGLSYTSFKYSGLDIEPPTITIAQPINITFTVQNTGTLAGDDVVQLYLRDLESSVTTPVKQLKGFKRVKELGPGETVTVTFTLLPERDLYLINRQLARVVEPGNHSVAIASSSADADVQLSGWFLIVR